MVGNIWSKSREAFWYFLVDVSGRADSIHIPASEAYIANTVAQNREKKCARLTLYPFFLVLLMIILIWRCLQISWTWAWAIYPLVNLVWPWACVASNLQPYMHSSVLESPYMCWGPAVCWTPFTGVYAQTSMCSPPLCRCLQWSCPKSCAYNIIYIYNKWYLYIYIKQPCRKTSKIICIYIYIYVCKYIRIYLSI